MFVCVSECVSTVRDCISLMRTTLTTGGGSVCVYVRMCACEEVLMRTTLTTGGGSGSGG